MPTFSSIPAVRDDFRCSICRQKQAFHCEHDTPYRDQLLGTYDQNQMLPMHSRRTSQRAGSVNSKMRGKSNTTTTTTANANHHSRDTQYQNSNYSRYQQGRDIQTNNSSTNGNHSKRTDEQKKKNKSCVIL